MAKRIIECQVNDEYVLGSGVVVGAAGSHDDVVLRLAFGEMWVGRNIYATFHDANGENPVNSMLMASMLVPGETMTYDVTIPAEAKRYAGKMMLTLTGYSIVDGVQEDMATNTTTAYFRVLPSDFSPLDDGTITPTLAQQVQNELREYYSVFEEQYSKIEGVATAERDRKTAEEGRVLAESERAVAEKTRSENEAVRVTAEDKRKTAEIDRAAAEDARKEADEKRDDFLGDLDGAVDNILDIQEKILNGNAELVAREEVIKAINEKMLIANDLDTDDPYKALSAAQGKRLYDILTNGEIANIETGWYNGTGVGNVELLLSYRPKVIFILGNIRYPSAENITSSVIERSWHWVFPEYEMYVSNGSAVKTDDIAINGTDVEFPCANKKSYYKYNPSNGGSTQTVVDTEADGYGYWYYAIG